MSCIVVFCNAPDVQCAKKIADALLEEHLAACVNILAACQSVFAWQGKVEYISEIPLVIKTNHANYAALQARIVELHSDVTPEIIAVPVVRGLPNYLQWIETCLSHKNKSNNYSFFIKKA